MNPGGSVAHSLYESDQTIDESRNEPSRYFVRDCCLPCTLYQCASILNASELWFGRMELQTSRRARTRIGGADVCYVENCKERHRGSCRRRHYLLTIRSLRRTQRSHQTNPIWQSSAMHAF